MAALCHGTCSSFSFCVPLHLVLSPFPAVLSVNILPHPKQFCSRKQYIIWQCHLFFLHESDSRDLSSAVEILLTSTNLSHLSCWFRKERKKKKITVGSPVTKFGNHPKKHFKRSYYFQSVNSTHMGWESFVDSMEPVNSTVNMSNS